MELWTAFLLGLVGSLHCAGMCGPIAMAQPVTGRTTTAFVTGRVAYNGGRITTYALMGSLFGVIGSSFALLGVQRWVSLIAGIAPMFGFLGTIIGMFQLFYTLAATGEFTIQSMANGIYTKMITSATGLIIGLIAYVAHNFLTTQVDKTAYKMEASSAEFLDVLQEPTR